MKIGEPAKAMICCDTSVIAKFYVAERESPALRTRLESEDPVCISELVRAELMSVFHRQLREKKWTRDNFLTAVRQFTNDEIGGFWTWLPLDATAQARTGPPVHPFLRGAGHPGVQ